MASESATIPAAKSATQGEVGADILRFPGVSAEHDRWSLAACRRRESFAGLVDRMAPRWPTLSREEAERKAHAMLLQLQGTLNAAGL